MDCKPKFKVDLRKKAFSLFVKSKVCKEVEDSWTCCGRAYHSLKEIHKHVALEHTNKVLELKNTLLEEEEKVNQGSQNMIDSNCISWTLPTILKADCVYSWLPHVPRKQDAISSDSIEKHGQILLFYHYKNIGNVQHVYAWQKELCKRLRLTGKVRISKEGINVTVGGSTECTELYIQSVVKHPLFMDMDILQFKKSSGSSHAFPKGLTIGIYQEAVPMGCDPHKVSFKDAGPHLTPEEFHQALEKHLDHNNSDSPDSIFIDCRNFYESKIGHFDQAVCPDIRKFSYWPEYVDLNEELFQNKNVYMYCTGGIRCERGSAYLKQKGVAKNVFQLEGGIHKYIEKYPDGYFKGKLFVFDDRYHIKANEHVLSTCTYCSQPWDEYQPCTSAKCYQLVLSCEKCRSKNLTACCKLCQSNTDRKMELSSTDVVLNEQCECTQKRLRIPVDVPVTL